VKKGKFSMEEKEWKHISKSAKNLVSKMLSYDPDKRISGKEAICDHWITNALQNSSKNTDTSLVENVLTNIKNFNAKEKFQQATLAYIVHFFYSSSELDNLREVFHQLNKSGDGRLTYAELKNGFEKVFGKSISDI